MPRGRPVGRGGAGRGQGRAFVPPPMTLAPGDHPQVSARIPIPFFDPDNYHIWAFEMQSHMAAEGCFGAIDLQTNDWVAADDSERASMRLRAFDMMRYSLGVAYQYISSEHRVGEAKELWDHLRDLYVKKGMDTQLRLDSRFQSLVWDHTRHHVDSFLADLSRIKAEFRTAEIPLSDERVFAKLLLCLPEQFDIEKAKMKDWEHPDLSRARVLLKDREDTLRERRSFESSQPLSEGSNFFADENLEGNMHRGRGRGRGSVRCYYCHRLLGSDG